MSRSALVIRVAAGPKTLRAILGEALNLVKILGKLAFPLKNSLSRLNKVPITSKKEIELWRWTDRNFLVKIRSRIF